MKLQNVTNALPDNIIIINNNNNNKQFRRNCTISKKRKNCNFNLNYSSQF